MCHSCGCEIIIVTLTCISLIENNDEHFFHVCIDVLDILLGELLFRSAVQLFCCFSVKLYIFKNVSWIVTTCQLCNV